MNIAKRTKAIVEHDRAEIEHERAQILLLRAVKGCGGNVRETFDRWREAHNWLGWAREGLRRHGAAKGGK